MHVRTFAGTLSTAVVQRVAVEHEPPLRPNRLRVPQQERQRVDRVRVVLHQVGEPVAESVLRLADVSLRYRPRAAVGSHRGAVAPRRS